MDSITDYRQVIKTVLGRYAKLRPSHGDIRLDTVFDDEQGRYALMQVGWDRGRRVRGNLIYVTMQKGMVWVEYDGIERGITSDLIGLGIPQDRIVLTFMQDEPLAMAA
ncbi:XisI protein [Anaerolineales bacterium HSG6]|nr:XisI protein [Anaerolineales bacterium HSG6]MDM8531162.1 XisI protein [Anaerolineales bacterium HSG25]